MRIFGKIFLWILGIAGMIIVAATILGRLFEEELTRYAIEGLNRQLRAEVKVADTDLSFLKKFPDATLEFREVLIASVPDFNASAFGQQNTDTLLSAGKLLLNFNVLKLFRQQYLLREVQVHSGMLNVYIDSEGKGNYKIWKEKEDKQGRDFRLELNNVKLTDILLSFNNKALEMDIRVGIRKSNFKGRFSSEEYNMSAGLQGMLHHYKNRGAVLLMEREISSDASMLVDPQSINITGGKFVVAGQHLAVEGRILRPAPVDLDLEVEGRQLDLENILRHIVLLSSKYPGDIRAGGRLDFRGSIKGTISSTGMPGIEAEFSLGNGWVRSPALPRELYEIGFSGNYSNGSRRDPLTTKVWLNDVSMRFGNSRLGGDFSISNLVSPTFDHMLRADIDLSDLLSVPVMDTIFDIINGRLMTEIRMQGEQKLLKNLDKTDFMEFAFEADMHLEEVSMKLRNIPFGFNDFSGDAVFTDHLNIKNLNGSFEGNQISLSGRVDNFLEFLLTPGGNLWMDADIYSEHVDLNYLRSIEGGPGNTDSDTILFPGRLYLKTQFWFDELVIKDFSAEHVMGNLLYKPGRLSINYLELLSMDGRVVSEGLVEQKNDLDFLVRSSSRIYSVEIGKAFSSFENFGQEFITNSHLSGLLSGSVDFSAELDRNMKIRKESILADCDVSIKNGGLSGFEPMLKLSRFIEVEELKDIRFSTLNNEIFIRNEEVVIPGMDIESSAFNITASGIHGFDRDFAYKIQLSLSELLAGKSRKPPEEESEFGVIEDDGLGNVNIFLIIEGGPEGTEVRYDRRGAVKNIREQLKEEKQELKQIFHEEFGLFSKDSTLSGGETGEDAPDFIIEWEEETDSTGPRNLKVDNNTARQKFIIIWDEDEAEEPRTDTLRRKKRRRKK
jgi:hypothetical protein